jgi:hypothetical protein
MAVALLLRSSVLFPGEALTSTLVVEIGSAWRAGAPPTRLA